MQGKSPLLVVCGTRPEAVKLSPVVRSLRLSGLRVVVLATGQHPDLAPEMFRELGMAADIVLPAVGRGVGTDQLLSALIRQITPLVRAARPAVLLVQGDTVSTMAGALAGAYAKVPVAHVEAGLRTGNQDDPHPEELHRRVVTSVASLHFAPTERSARNLVVEGVAEDSIHVTGNTGIDALLATCARLATDSALRERAEACFQPHLGAKGGFVLATVHRNENNGARLFAIAGALARLAQLADIDVLLPLHPNPAIRGPLQQRLQGKRGIHLLEPLDHGSIVWLMQNARLLLTDSGGLQEEAPTLGLRTLVLRAATERPEAIDAGASVLVPPDSDAIVAAALDQLARPKLRPLFPYGNGHAAERITEILVDWLGIRKQPVARVTTLRPLALRSVSA